MCGMFEINNGAWNAENKKLSCRAQLLAVEPITVTISAPPGWQPNRAESVSLAGRSLARRRCLSKRIWGAVAR